MIKQREGRLLLIAFVFLFLYSVILSLSPTVRENSWAVSYRLSHWIGFFIWSITIYFIHRILNNKLPDHDPYLLPLASLLTGWGVLTIWRLDPSFGLRQALWMVISMAAFTALLFTPNDLYYLRKYKYVLLSGALILTGLTLLLGTNPAGFGPRLWLGFAGIFLQPSEPLKLLFVVYLAAYLADRLPIRIQAFPILIPTVFVTGLAILLLLVQRELGTACIFIFLYSSILYVATDKRRVLLTSIIGLILAGFIGYFFIDIVHARFDSWINPWNDPSGRSYQIIQSLLAIANGGVFGRGPGLGSPSLVPVAHSDFIFTAIAEETGLLGTFGLLCIFGIILDRGLNAAINATDKFHRLLAAGLTAYLGIQALLIIGGNIRMLPLTGVTLPFVSYGGSSLLTSSIALVLLLIISNKSEKEPATILSLRSYYRLASLLGFGIIAASLTNLWWSVIRSSDLLARTDNPRRSISDRYVIRGMLLDRNNQPIDITQGKTGDYQRVYLYPQLSPITGYTNPIYGQAGLEQSLDDYLRGLQAYPAGTIWWNELLYGTPPPGLNIRLSIDLTLQEKADNLMENIKGAVVLLNARSGEILILSSHPNFDPNKLNETGSTLAKDKNSPLIDRAAQGMYPLGTAINPFLETIQYANSATQEELISLYTRLGFFSSPQIRTPVANADSKVDINSLQVSPLQLAIASGSLSNKGILAAPRIALAVDTVQQSWIVLPALGTSSQIFTPKIADTIALRLASQNQPYWEWSGRGQSKSAINSWYLAGTLPNWQGTPLALVVLIEGDEPVMAQTIGRQLIQESIKP
jgi:cell division protein FtsW (lipid II flippase)